MNARRAAKSRPAETSDVPEEMHGFPERLTLARVQAGLKTSDLGSSRLEAGCRVRRLSALRVIQLAHMCRVRPAWLLTGEEPMSVDFRANLTPIFAEEAQK